MYNNPYYNNYSGYNAQASIERINNQIAELEKMKSQIPQTPIPNQQPTSINQTFQLAPNNNANNSSIRYANTLGDVEKELVVGDTPFFSQDMAILWLKSASGDIKTYGLTEIIQKDEKDLMIESLQYQIQELRKEVSSNAKSDDTNANEPIEEQKPTSVSRARKTTTK